MCVTSNVRRLLNNIYVYQGRTARNFGENIVPEEEDMPNGKHSVDRSSDGKEQIEYIADLILELTEMARARKLHTLAGILDLAYKEANLRSRDRI